LIQSGFGLYQRIPIDSNISYKILELLSKVAAVITIYVDNIVFSKIGKRGCFTSIQFFVWI